MKNYWLDKKNASFAPAPCETMVWIRSADDWVWIKVPKTEIPIDAYFGGT